MIFLASAVTNSKQSIRELCLRVSVSFPLPRIKLGLAVYESRMAHIPHISSFSFSQLSIDVSRENLRSSICNAVKGKAIRCNRPWRPIALWDIEAPTSYRHSSHRWRRCQPYAPDVLCHTGRFLLLISVGGWVELKAIAWLEGLGNLIGNGSRYLPAGSTVPQSTRPLRVRWDDWWIRRDLEGSYCGLIDVFLEAISKCTKHTCQANSQFESLDWERVRV
jgi:hypothetical protein